MADFFVLADQILGKRKHVKELIKFYQRNPRKVKLWLKELDEAINQFNQTDKFPPYCLNAIYLKNVLKRPLPMVNQVLTGRHFHKKTLELMNDFNFFDDVWLLEKLAAASIVAFYRTYLLISEPYLKAKNAQVASAIEEVLSLMSFNGDSTELFEVTKFWLKDWQKEGFSRELAEKIK